MATRWIFLKARVPNLMTGLDVLQVKRTACSSTLRRKLTGAAIVDLA